MSEVQGTDRIVELLKSLSGLSLEQDNAVPRALFEQLLDSMREYSPLSTFERTHSFVCGCVALELEHLAWWMIHRTATVGAEQSLSEAVSFTLVPEFDAVEVMMLAGAGIPDGIHDLGGGVHIMNPSQAPLPISDGWLAQLKHVPGAIPIRSDATLTRGQRYKKWNARDPLPNHNPTFGDALQDARRCLVIAIRGCVAMECMGLTVIPAPHVPAVESVGWTMHTFTMPHYAPLLTPEVLPRAREIHGAFCDLNDASRNQYRVVMDHLCTWASRGLLVEKAIHLRVAMEALFLDDDAGEATYRLGTHAALAVSGPLPERRHMRDIMKKAYRASSKAVHGGRGVESKDRQALEEAAEFTRSTLVGWILDRRPPVDWKDIVIQGEAMASLNPPLPQPSQQFPIPEKS